MDTVITVLVCVLPAFFVFLFGIMAYNIARDIRHYREKCRKYGTDMFCLDCGGPYYYERTETGTSSGGHVNVIPVHICADCGHENYFWCGKQYSFDRHWKDR